jgi:hypothetical protein
MSGIEQHIPLFSIDGLGQSVASRDTGDESLNKESEIEYHGSVFPDCSEFFWDSNNLKLCFTAF